MAKNYQITQYEEPLGTKGVLKLTDGKEVGITRVHIEEDPAALVHPSSISSSSYVMVDYNRSGDPLCEVVTEPDLESPAEAREFMRRLIEVVRYLDIFDINTCIIKADANVSIREAGYVRTEIKNITGFKEIERALNYEVNRQREAVKTGEGVRPETRGWDPEKGITILQRAKESEEDYGYILDPDLTVTDITDDMVTRIREDMPELAQQRVERFVSGLGIDREDARVIAAERRLADVFEELAKEHNPVMTARWIRRELLRVLNYNKLAFDEAPVTTGHLKELLGLLSDGKITDVTAKRIIEELVLTPFDVHAYVQRNNLEAVSDTQELEEVCRRVVDENPQAASELADGNEKAMNFLVGQVMRYTKGKASPKEVNSLIRRLVE